MAAAGARVEGLAELRASLSRANEKALDAGLKATWREVEQRLAAQVRAAAATGTRQQAAAAGALVGAAEELAASIEITYGIPFGPGAFLGAVQWRQFPAWVGAAWDIASGQGPYVVAPTIAAHLPEITEQVETGTARTLEQLGIHVGA